MFRYARIAIGMRQLLSRFWFIHLCALLGCAAIYGYLQTDSAGIAVCIGLSFSGAVCGSFIRVIDAVKRL
jgi:hypothetical protein